MLFDFFLLLIFIDVPVSQTYKHCSKYIYNSSGVLNRTNSSPGIVLLRFYSFAIIDYLPWLISIFDLSDNTYLGLKSTIHRI